MEKRIWEQVRSAVNILEYGLGGISRYEIWNWAGQVSFKVSARQRLLFFHETEDFKDL